MAETETASDASRPRVFVSYSREDSAFAGRLGLVLNDRGFETVIDREEVDAAGAWKARIRPLIVSSDLVIVLLTANSATLDSARWESDLAASVGKRIVVVVPAPLEEGIVLSQPVATSQWFHFYQNPARADSGIYAGPALEEALKTDLEWRRQYTRLLLQAEKWKEQSGADGLLLRGDALNAALTWRASIPRGQTLVLTVADFIDASEQAEASRVEPTGSFESRLMHLEERRAAAKEAAHAARAKRDEPPPAPTRILSSAQLANVPLAPVHTPSSLPPSPAEREESASSDVVRVRSASTALVVTKRAPEREKRKSLVAPALIALLLFAGAGAVVWQVLPQFMASRVAVADAPALSPATPAGTTMPAVTEVALAETSPSAPVAPEATPAPPVQTAAQPEAPPPAAAQPVATKPAASKPAATESAATGPVAPQPAAAEPAAAAGPSSELADWRAARDVGNIAAWRTYMLKWPKGERRDLALSAIKKRMETLSTKPASLSVTLPGPVAYRELPTFRDKGAPEGAAGQTVTVVDRIASPKEGEWLVVEQDGAWPFRFISAREIEAKQ